MSTAPKTAPSDTTIETFFETKTTSDVAGTMAFFSPDLVSYIDPTLGWEFNGYDALKAVFEQYMPNWSPPARSYATGVLANETRGLLRTTATPELFGGEQRILAAVGFAEGKIVRWIDYRDSSSFDDALYASLRTPGDSFLTDLTDGPVATQVPPELVAVATALQGTFGAADATAGGELMHTDVLLEDMSLRTQVIGRIEATAYLGRILDAVPYDRSSRLRHVGGGGNGGGFEWTAGPGANSLPRHHGARTRRRGTNHEDHRGLRLGATRARSQGPPDRRCLRPDRCPLLTEEPPMSSQETAVRRCRHAFGSSRDCCAKGSLRPRCHVRACLP
ncbi:MAG TPA: nuclear transport factor 2 family protein [Solirubrobacteraceae bacterium]|nr:nuclear transport factor 2 family protein [Solirubrobacteraceae bacterium]